MIVRARHVLPLRGSPIENGAAVVAGNQIAAVGRWGEIAGDGETRDLGDVVLLPGLINAHAHLDYTDMHGQVRWRGEFFDWIYQVTALKKTWSAQDYRRSIQHGLEQAVASGTTTVVNAGGSGETVAETPCRVWWCLELIDLVWSEESQRMAEAAALWVANHPPGGLAPHAPYTVSEQLYKWAADTARARHWLLTTHVAESPGEDRRWRVTMGKNCIAAHANWLTEEEMALLAHAGTSVAHCPRTHQYFERLPVPMELWSRHGINICLGTDSLASNESLDLRAEMRALARVFPSLPLAHILAMATVNPAKALNQADRLGTLAPGACADMIGVSLERGVGDPYEAVVCTEQPVVFIMIDGKIVSG